VIKRLYQAFASKDAATMGDCYADSATFSDPVFQRLDAQGARDMWSMLCGQGKDLELTYSDVKYDDPDARNGPATAHWVAEYTFGVTGRHVTNRISAKFELKDGLITRHVDTFDYDLWLKQALGPIASVLGWTGLLHTKVRKTAADNLARFQSNNAKRP